MRIAYTYREEHFSPGSVEKDRAIMDAVVAELQNCGVVELRNYGIAELRTGDDMDVVLSMGREDDLLDVLEKLEHSGVRVINSPRGVRLCNNRYTLNALLKLNGIAIPPESGQNGIWVKRGDASAEIKDDVTLCHTEAEVEATIARMQQRGITSWVKQAHIPGDLVKFYGVAERFFTHSYPTDSGHSKFGLESANGTAQHYTFDLKALQYEADKVARLTGVSIYGGDAIVRADGSFAIIDFNDWPTFSSCRQEAAKAIASLITNV